MTTIRVTAETYLVALDIDAERWEGAEELSVVTMEEIIRVVSGIDKSYRN